MARNKELGIVALVIGVIAFGICETSEASVPQSATKVAPSPAPPPEQLDAAFQRSKNRYFLVVAVDKSSADADVPFANVDGNKVAKVLSDLGYKRIVPAPLIGAMATRSQIVDALHKTKVLSQNSSLVVYYSGHGTPDSSGRLWLHTGDVRQVEPGFGITLSDVVSEARSGVFSGELIIILDACFSGAALRDRNVTLEALGEKTVLLTSSSATEESYSSSNDGKSESPFTHFLLRGLTEDWAKVDENGDGIVTMEEIYRYTMNSLAKAFEDKELRARMTPHLVTNDPDIFMAYQRQRVINWHSPQRETYTRDMLERALAAGTADAPQIAKYGLPETSSSASQLAAQIGPTRDPYDLALKAIAEHRTSEALRFLTQAANEHTIQLGKIYLAEGRTQYYAGKLLDSLDAYKKAFDQGRDPVALCEGGQVAHFVGRDKESEELLLEALAFFGKKGGEDLSPNCPFVGLAHLYRDQGNYEEADSFYQQAEQYALEPALKASLFLDRAQGLAVRGSFTEAAQAFDRAREIRQSLQDLEGVAHVVSNQGTSLMLQSSFAQADDKSQEALRLYEQLGLTSDLWYVETLETLALIKKFRGDYQEAESLYQRSISICLTVNPDTDDLGRIYFNFAKLYFAKHDPENAAVQLQNALANMRKSELRAVQTQIPYAEIELANALAGVAKYKEAEQSCTNAIEHFHDFGQDNAYAFRVCAWIERELGNINYANYMIMQASPILWGPE